MRDSVVFCVERLSWTCSQSVDLGAWRRVEVLLRGRHEHFDGLWYAATYCGSLKLCQSMQDCFPDFDMLFIALW